MELIDMADTANSTPTSEIDRRTAMRGLAAGAAVGFVMSSSDPLIEAIQAYRDGLADYEANAPRHDDELAEAYAQASYEPPMIALDNWTGQASSKEGAIAALELALEEHNNFASSPMAAAMIKAAAGFLKA